VSNLGLAQWILAKWTENEEALRVQQAEARNRHRARHGPLGTFVMRSGGDYPAFYVRCQLTGSSGLFVDMVFYVLLAIRFLPSAISLVGYSTVTKAYLTLAQGSAQLLQQVTRSSARAITT
jgi:hypothetical protein